MTKNWTIAIALNVLMEGTHEVIRGVMAYGGLHAGLQFRDVHLLNDEDIPRLLRKYPCDGAIVTITPQAFELVSNDLPPLPMVNLGTPKISDAIPAVRGVRGESSKVLLAHLRDQGYESFAYLGFGESDLKHRGENLKRILGKGEPPLAELWLPGYGFEELEDEHLEKLKSWLNKLLATCRRTAVITFDGYRAALVVEACQQLEVAIPEQVGVATYTESRQSRSTTPAITGIDTPYYEEGFAAARILHSMLQGADPPREPVEVTGASVNVRGSTAPPDIFHNEIEFTREFMQKNFTKNICLEDCLSQLGNITRDNFFRSFKSQAGTTPAQYLQNLKVKLAKQMLISTSFSMTRIAEVCGFSSLSHFGRTFKRVVGEAPRQYRQNFGNASAMVKSVVHD